MAPATVDVTLLVDDGADSIGVVIDSVLAQTWPSIVLTLLDNATAESTATQLGDCAAQHAQVRLKRNRHKADALANLQRALWMGDANYVLTLTAGQGLPADLVEQLIVALNAQEGCVLCHGSGVWEALQDDPLVRAQHVMGDWPDAPMPCGLFRRDAVNRLSTLRHRPGAQQALLAELALYGGIRGVAAGLRPWPQPHQAQDMLADLRWRTPWIAAAHTHIEAFSAAHLPLAQRLTLIEAVPGIFRNRWLPRLRAEAAALHAAMPALLESIAVADPPQAAWLTRTLSDVLQEAQVVLPDAGFSLPLLELFALSGEVTLPAAQGAPWSR